ncbi:MAG: hypothetical protein K9K67_02130 [Bacteriovoracaceae bacterium]|nr:hypothetical protein [Bacteriovoracaceae bacterium]
MIDLKINLIRQKFQSIKVGFLKPLNNSRGQSFIEFLFLLLILMGLSITLITGINGTVAKQWKALVQAIAIPNADNNFEL